ncbi:nuclear transport factor 2 family protein [Aggregatimonas sangjinii]|uniref:Nuclear transport factor 2 family protein n=1 Tax=Aggregatimonas sangjinii TaxID=2583587 RepID=A0A5B7SSN1_9FLAO|nr:nuclear transport factor 2 family protein [Aggregatimonas sangjinii]QCX01537.1 nuclear transport factor 2 family protein [Aggregatimonas sangjinii]
MRTYFLTILLIATVTAGRAQTEEEAIKFALQSYIDGSSYSDPEKIAAPFYDDARMFLYKEDQPLYILSVPDYCAFFENRERGKFNGRTGNILSVDRENDIATAKVEILIADRDMRFIDMFLLKKLNGEWKIISKSATLMPEAD